MSHMVRGKVKLLNRTRRIRGRVEALERALEGERECGEVRRLIAAACGATDSLMAEVLESHIREHAAADYRSRGAAMAAANDLIDLVRAYLK
jgi:FrmR/RcnR family transcriptional regulator, repressor of frmRAB operon